MISPFLNRKVTSLSEIEIPYIPFTKPQPQTPQFPQTTQKPLNLTSTQESPPPCPSSVPSTTPSSHPMPTPIPNFNFSHRKISSLSSENCTFAHLNFSPHKNKNKNDGFTCEPLNEQIITLSVRKAEDWKRYEEGKGEEGKVEELQVFPTVSVNDIDEKVYFTGPDLQNQVHIRDTIRNVFLCSRHSVRL